MDYLWLDLETTGLDPTDSEIVEVYAEIRQDHPLGRPKDTRGASFERIRRVRNWGFAEEGAIRCHLTSGLLGEAMLAPSLSEEDMLDELAVWLGDNTKSGDAGPHFILCGFNPGFDLGFFKVKADLIAEMIHYRLFDLSTCAYLLGGRGGRGSAHRAKGDVLAGQEFLGHFISRFSVGGVARQWVLGG